MNLGKLRWLWRSIHLCRISGVPVQIHTTSFVFPWGVTLWSGWMADRWQGLGLMLAVMLIVQVSFLIHEFPHVLTARHFGCETRRVLMLPIGCLAELEWIRPEWEELWVAASGPAASALLALVAWGCGFLGGIRDFSESVPAFILYMAGFYNLVLAVFNLLPCFPMDGGRILRSALALILGRICPCRAYSAHLTATRIAVRYVARPLILSGLAITVLWTHFCPHLLLLAFLVLAGEAECFFLREAARGSASPFFPRLLPGTTREGARMPGPSTPVH